MVAMEMVPKNGLGEAPVSLLKVAEGPLLSSLAYSRAVEAVVSAAKQGLSGSEWRDAAVRLLQSRSNSPLALLWSFLAFHKWSLERDGNSDSLIAVAQKLLQSLKFMTAGFCGGPTAIAAAAPIVQMVVSSFANNAGLSQKKKKLRKLIFELSGFISLCHHKQAPATHGLFKAPSVNLGLDLWLSEPSDFSSLFPFAAQLKVDGYRNSIDSVLLLGEIVETEVALLRLVVEILQSRASPNKEELERKLKHDVILYSNFLCSSGIILDMLLDAPLKLGDLLEDKEEMLLRVVLSEMAVIIVPNFDVSTALPTAGDNTAGKESVLFLKRVIIARQLAAEFRSRNEYLRASDLLAGLHRRGAPASLGAWLADRSSLRLLISTDVLVQKPQALLDWLLNASNADFRVVLEKACIEPPKIERLEASEETQDPDSEQTLFFIDTSKAYEKASAGLFDADQAYLMAAGEMQVAAKEEVLFDRLEQVERKRSDRSEAGRSRTAKKRKQKEDSNGALIAQPDGEDVIDSDDIVTSEDESEEESEMRE